MRSGGEDRDFEWGKGTNEQTAVWAKAFAGTTKFISQKAEMSLGRGCWRSPVQPPAHSTRLHQVSFTWAESQIPLSLQIWQLPHMAFSSVTLFCKWRIFSWCPVNLPLGAICPWLRSICLHHLYNSPWGSGRLRLDCPLASSSQNKLMLSQSPHKKKKS